MWKLLRPDAFVVCLLLMIVLAYWTPQFGAAQGKFSPGKIADVGILLIFFMYGAGMSFRALWKGLANWRLHLLVHASTFLIFPLIVLSAFYFGHRAGEAESTRLLWLGVFYVAALPSTVSSSVVMVSIARGNMPAAIFNASISGLLGVFLTPLWMNFFLGIVSPGETTTGEALSGAGLPLLESIRDLMLIVVLPVGLGMSLNRWIGERVLRSRKFTKYFDQAVVLLIVYTSFSESFLSGAFDGFGAKTLILLGLGMIALFYAVYGISGLCCRIFRFNREDTITVRFCGSKKSLMHGMAMSKVLLAGIGGAGVVLLPIMLYHALQLVVVSVIAKRESSNRQDGPKE